MNSQRRTVHHTITKKMPTNLAGILTYGVQQNHNKSTGLTVIVILLQKYKYFYASTNDSSC
jgi:hypothetical protein